MFTTASKLIDKGLSWAHCIYGQHLPTWDIWFRFIELLINYGLVPLMDLHNIVTQAFQE